MEVILTTLLSWYAFDLWFVTQWWAWVFILPIICYLPFFVAKWALVTLPLWLPVHLALKGMVVVKNKIKKEKPSKEE